MVTKANAGLDLVAQIAAVLDAHNAALSLRRGGVDGINQLLGLTGALQAHNNINHRKLLLC